MDKLKAYRNTLIVTAVFALIYFALIIVGANALWLWVIFTIAWIAAEWKFASDSPLKTWHWVAIIVCLVVAGMAVDIAVA